MRLELQGFAVRYGAIEAIRGIDLVVAPGAITVIVGANGAGKSTLLNAVMGLVRPSAGRILLDGADITRQPAEARAGLGVTLSPEGRRLFPDLTVEENLLAGAYSRREQSASLDMARVFDLFPPIARRRRQAARNLSGGEQQMVAIGRALMARPGLLLLDEPSLGLAPIIVDRLGEVIRDINRDGVTVLLVEQDARWALQLAHMGHIMDGGRLTTSAAASELLADHQVQRAYLGGALPRQAFGGEADISLAAQET